MVSLSSESNKNVFAICTNSLRKQNEVHVIEFDDQSNKISKNYINYHKGVLEDIIPADESHFFLSYRESKYQSE